jgi:hypothetical protein
VLWEDEAVAAGDFVGGEGGGKVGEAIVGGVEGEVPEVDGAGGEVRERGQRVGSITRACSIKG